MKLSKISKNKKILLSLILIDLLLVVLHLITQKYLEREASLPTWFSQIQLFVAAAITFYIAKINNSKLWYFLSIIMLYLSIDEGSEIHELATEYLQNKLGIESGYLFFAWIIPAAIIIVILGLLYFKFWWNLPKKTRILIALSAIIFVSGGLIIEMISANYWVSHEFQFDFTYRILNAFEEGFEMIAISLYIYAFLDYLKK